MTGIWQDVRLALRAVSRQRALSAVVIATLALTIGAATVVFSLFDAVLLRPFPYREPERLVRLRTVQPMVPGSERDASIADYRDWQERAHSFAATAQSVSFTNSLTGRGPARIVAMTFTTPELFDLLGVAPLLGRSHTAAEDVLGGDVRKAVLSHALWIELFGGDPGALGQTLQLRGQAYSVIGVMPPGFSYPDRTQVWVPLMARYTDNTSRVWERRDARFHEVIARLAPGVSLRQAQSDLSSITAALAREHPDSNSDVQGRVLTLREAEAGRLEPYVWLVLAGVLALVAIGCVNVANLLLARATTREREMALRTALGADAWRLVRQVLVETCVYAACGSLTGAGLAVAGVRSLRRLIPVELPPWMALGVDARVLAFTAVLAVLVAIGAALAPTLQSVRADPNDALKAGARGSSDGRSRGAVTRRVLIVAEIAMSLVLLVAAGLMLRSFVRVLSVDTGVTTDRLLLATISRYVPGQSRGASVKAYADEFRRVRDRLLELPGVTAATAGNDVPYLNQPEQRPAYEIYTRARATRDLAFRGPAQGADVMPGYFAVLGIPVLEGRDFTEADTLGAEPVIIISHHAALTLFPDRPALGQQVRWGSDEQFDPWMTIVGIVGDTRWQPAETSRGLEMYWSYRQYPTPSTHLLVRTSGNPESLLPALRSVIQEVNPDLAVERVKTMAAVASESVWQRRLSGFVMAVFAGLALLLAAIGLYGVISFWVTERTRELGIRIALGAGERRVLVLVLRQALTLTVLGLGLGLAAWLACGRWLSILLFDVSTTDWLTLVAVPLLLVTVAAAAAWLPARRAARLEPLVALRDD